MRSLATIGAVLALLAGVAIPAYAATTGSGDPSAGPSAHDLAEQNAQSLAVGADVKAHDLDVSKYAATTPEEIAKKKAEEEAAKRAKEAAAAAAAEAAAADAAAAETSSVSSVPPSAPTDSGKSVTPVNGTASPVAPSAYCISRSVSSGHSGADLATSGARPPIYAAKSGTVTISSESYFGYGVAVKIQHPDGTETLYGHMTYGSRQVSVGQKVTAGQQIGLVGDTGHSFGEHLHFEYHIGGSVVDPVPYFNLGPWC